MTLQDAINKDIFIIDNSQFSDADLQRMTSDELETLKMWISRKISDVSASLKEKQIDYANGGEGATKDWYMKCKYALSLNQHVLHYVNLLIKKHRCSERSISDFFMSQAKTILSPREYELILSSAYKEMNTGLAFLSKSVQESTDV